MLINVYLTLPQATGKTEAQKIYVIFPNANGSTDLQPRRRTSVLVLSPFSAQMEEGQAALKVSPCVDSSSLIKNFIFRQTLFLRQFRAGLSNEYLPSSGKKRFMHLVETSFIHSFMHQIPYLRTRLSLRGSYFSWERLIQKQVTITQCNLDQESLVQG